MMSDPVPVLTGWKAIAGFLKRDERTAMRWAAERGLPVRRVPGGKRGPVYAVPSEITEWLAWGAHGDTERRGEHEIADINDNEQADVGMTRPPMTENGASSPMSDDLAGIVARPRATILPTRAARRSIGIILATVLAGATGTMASIKGGLFPHGLTGETPMERCRNVAHVVR